MSEKTKILYVEDEVLLGKIVKESLESRNYDVYHVMDGAKVLDACATYAPTICILDVMLPHVDGFELGKRLRQRHPQLPIIFLTAKTQTQDTLQGFQSGGNDYIKKPFSMEELIVRIENILQLTQGPSLQEAETEHPVSLGEFSFNPYKYELMHPQHARKLSHREAQLLKILILHQNRTASRKDILLEVWGDDSFLNSRNLDVYIKRLRDYFKPDPRIHIMTLKGVGYHFYIED
ncbi:MAG: response regulator transcription factor [Bacteroidota bacterium]